MIYNGVMGGSYHSPFGLATLGFGSSFFFFILGPSFLSISAFLFFPPIAPSIFLPPTFLLVVLPAFVLPGAFSGASSSSLSSSAAASATPAPPSPTSPFFLASSSLAASRARSLASRASFLRCAFSFLIRRQAAMCSLAAVLRMLFLQCLHCCRSGLSSSGRPVAKVSRAASSRGLTTGPGEAAVMALAVPDLAFFSSPASRTSYVRHAHDNSWEKCHITRSCRELTIEYTPLLPVARLAVLWRRLLEFDVAIADLLGLVARGDLDGRGLLVWRA